MEQAQTTPLQTSGLQSEEALNAMIDGSFLRRVPGLMADGMGMEEAIKKAKADEDALCWRLVDAHKYEFALDSAGAEAFALMCRRVYDRARGLA